MEGGKCRTGTVRRGERSFECSRLAEQLLSSAYERVVPLIWKAMERDSRTLRSTVAAAETAAPTFTRIGAA
jgi:hypothetical protein